MQNKSILSYLDNQALSDELKDIAKKVLNQQRISVDEGVYLYEHGELGFLGALANYVREEKNGNATFFNRNFHIEPTNICVFACNFCSYSRLLKEKEEGWELSMEQMMDIVRKYDGQAVTEVHIVGGVHPKMNLDFFNDLLRQIKQHRPDLHIKGFTAVELDYMFRKAKVSVEEGLKKMKEAGLDSIPGGGAEIFDEKVRAEICGDKCTSEEWTYRNLSSSCGSHGSSPSVAGSYRRFQYIHSS
jgi:aminodeoxyfutalosine synthase